MSELVLLYECHKSMSMFIDLVINQLDKFNNTIIMILIN